MGMNDLAHHVRIGEGNVVEDAAAQESIRQFLFRIGRNDDNGPLFGADRLPRFGNVKFHAVQFPQEVIGKFQVRLIDFINEKDALLIFAKSLAQLAQMDVFFDVIHSLGTKLAVIKTLHRIIDIESVLSLRCRFDVPNEKLHAQAVRNGLGQHGLSRSRFSFDEERFLERRCNVDTANELWRGNIRITSLELFHKVSFSGPLLTEKVLCFYMVP